MKRRSSPSMLSVAVVSILVACVSPALSVVQAQEDCPPPDCVAGRDVERDFFDEVVEQLTDVPVSDFAVDALEAWEPHENTAACWNPLATTQGMKGSCDFNTAGVQHYLNQDMGTEATAKTLALAYYDSIRSMLRQDRFDSDALRDDLATWGTCSGASCDALLRKWEDLWDARQLSDGRFLSLPFYKDPNVRVQQGWHGGIDYIKGTLDNSGTWKTFDVLAAADGEACANCTTSYEGDNVFIKHTVDGETYYTYYGHLASIESFIPEGSQSNTVHVERGQKIGTAGSTGMDEGKEDWVHLHFGVRNASDLVDPYDLYTTDRSQYYPGGANYTEMGPNHLFTQDPPLYGGPAGSDVYLLVDLSGSFSDDLPIFKNEATDLVSNPDPNTRFGLGKFEDYPIEPFGSAAAGDKAYERIVDLTFETDALKDAIAGLYVRSGGDGPESQFPALYQAASGEGQDLSEAGYPDASIPEGQQANFRDGVSKLFILWTDAPFHYPGDAGDIPYPGPSFADTVDAILALDPPLVLGISSGGGGMSDLQAIATATGALAPSGGVDCDGDGTTDIPEGEPLVCSIAGSGAGIGEAIKALAEEAASLPIADAGGPYNGFVGETITFDGSGSFDPDGSVSLYEWDFESDGVFDSSSANSTAQHSYASEFAGTVTLRVTDDDGGTGVDTAPVNVEIAPPVGGLTLPSPPRRALVPWSGLVIVASFSLLLAGGYSAIRKLGR